MTTQVATYSQPFVLGARLAAAGAIAATAMMLSAPAGNAIPESTIVNECDQAGGTYTTTVHEGKRYSKCCYRDIGGVQHCDNYQDGTYTTTDGALEVPPTQPPPSRGEVGLPPTEAAPPTPVDPDGGMTIYLPPGTGPVGPPPGGAVLAP
ncbi:hypothetical protein [Mycolicibacterium lacusdiani]|uniref:hypothetical protein n=1 Tax=Mycolicibacterium lacusdiani TaxID=2895283 RepID=UPI001F165571|nr:hypothetical protein [Mycolicibacterium lacusdiani]